MTLCYVRFLSLAAFVTLALMLSVDAFAQGNLNCPTVNIQNHGCAFLSASSKGRDAACVDTKCQAAGGTCRDSNDVPYVYQSYKFVASDYCDCVSTTTGTCPDSAQNFCGVKSYFLNLGCLSPICTSANWQVCGCVMSGC